MLASDYSDLPPELLMELSRAYRPQETNVIIQMVFTGEISCREAARRARKSPQGIHAACLRRDPEWSAVRAKRAFKAGFGSAT